MSRHVPRHTFRCPPPPLPCHGGTAGTGDTGDTSANNTTQHNTAAAAPCDTTHPMWRHRGTARPKPPPPPPPSVAG